jgi:hypothetical protein
MPAHIMSFTERNVYYIFVCMLVLCTQVNMVFVMLLCMWINTVQAEKFACHGGNRTRDLWDTSPPTHTQKMSYLRIYT